MQSLKSSVHKTFAILEYFTIQKPEWGVTELATAIGSNKSTIYRFLSDLTKLGVLYKDPNSEKYSLGLKLFELGNRVRLNAAFVDKTHPVLVEVAKQITETVHIAIWKEQQAFHVDKVESPQGLKISSHIGSYAPAYSTSLGKVLLAYLPKEEQSEVIQALFQKETLKSFTEHTITKPQALIKELTTIKSKGYALDREECEIGLICVGIPIFNQANEVVASLSASGPSNRFKEEKIADYVAILQKGATAIQQKIGYFKP